MGGGVPPPKKKKIPPTQQETSGIDVKPQMQSVLLVKSARMGSRLGEGYIYYQPTTWCSIRAQAYCKTYPTGVSTALDVRIKEGAVCWVGGGETER